MLDIQKIIKNADLLKHLTNYNRADFSKLLKKWKRRRNMRTLKTSECQLFYKLFMEYVTPTNAVSATLFGAKGRNRTHEWNKVVGVEKSTSSKIKTIGAFFQKFPQAQEAYTSHNIYIPMQITTTPTLDEMRRLKIVATTEDPRMKVLLEFRLDIIEQLENEPIDKLVYRLYTEKYGELLEEMSNKELAYLWGVSVEYMTRVSNSFLKNLDLTEEELKEKLLYGY